MNMEELIQRYVMSPRYQRLANSSQLSYKHALKTLAKYFGAKDIKKIKRSDFIALQEKMVKTPGLSSLAIRVASVVFEYGVDLDLIPFNPAARIKKPEGGSYEKWTIDDVKKALAECADSKVVTAIALGWYTGQRECDILEMRWRDIEGGYVGTIQNKTKMEMKIRLHPDIISFLMERRGRALDSDFIVSGRKPMTPAAFRARFRRRMDEIGISKTFHGVRKGVACSIAERGGSTKEIAAILGHKTLRMAAYYAEQAEHTILTENAVNQLPSAISARASG